MSHRAFMLGHLESAEREYNRIRDFNIDQIAPFAHLYRKLLQHCSLDPARSAYMTASANHVSPLSLGEADRLISSVADLFVYDDRYETLAERVRLVMFVNQLEVPEYAEIALRALERARPRLSFEGKVVHLELALAVHQAERALPLVRELLADEASRTSVTFARVGSLVAARLRDGALEREILCRFVPPAEARTPLEAAQTFEVVARRDLRNLNRPLEVFVGFFGQLREPEVLLPPAVRAIRAAFSDTRYGHFNLHFALSAWERTGGRTLEMSDSAIFFSEVAPVPARRLLNSENGSTGWELATRFPNLVAAMLNHSKMSTARDVSTTELHSYLPDGAEIAIGSELSAEEEFRPALARVGREFPHTVNQLKMWSRIAALNEPLLAHENTIGRMMDVCLMIRCDLGGIQGSLTETAARAASPFESRSIFYDHDQHAEYIQGAGDRYMLGSRASIQALMQGYAHHLGVINGDPSGSLIGRLTAHEGVQSVMMLNGLTPAPVWALQYELRRSTVANDVVRSALIRDLDDGDSGLRDEIETVIAELGELIGTETH